MKILLTGFQFATIGGLEIVSANIANALTRSGHEVQCAAVHAIGTTKKDSYRIVGLVPANRFARALALRVPGLFPMAGIRALVEWADVVIACHCHTLPLVYQAGGGGRGKPVVAWLHGREVWGRFGREYAPHLARADRLVAVSHYTSDTVEDLLGPRHRPLVIHNSLDTELFVPAAGARDIERFSIATVGRQDPGTEHKGYDMLLEALALIHRRPDAPPLTLKIAGDGALVQRRREKAVALGIADRVTFTGALSRGELCRLYATCDLFAFPSRVLVAPGDDISGEGFGVVNIEAAACGRPVLTSTHGGCPETILDGKTGVLVDPTSVRAIADGIERIFRLSAEERDAMGRHGRSRVVAEFSHDTLSRRIDDLLREVVAG